MKNLKPITFSFIVSLGIAFVFLMATFYILAYSDPNAMSDALSTTGSYFGALSTLAAAIIAAYLYTDWKEPHFVSKIASEQKEIITLTRRMKRNIDAFSLFMRTRKPFYTGLNNGDEFALQYQTLVNNILDDIDDLAGLIKAYEFNFKDDTTHEREHLHRLNTSQDILGELHSVFAEPNPVLGYIDSYLKVKAKVDSGELIELYKEILFNMPDYLSKYYSTLARR
ncbi:hypothetical protein [Acinetobacter variabilis]|uniref:hypothetical protein n=1 Tax=Acinetobacter variabilis TaxID=70346 RepID=UPI0028A10CD4|nr:hypothetical protein [Acinetobacter variabilis]